jgi:GNAT superfamily N-acetyltransferase
VGHSPSWPVLGAPRNHLWGRLLQVGFCSFYSFYSYPDSSRLRLSQILVLPPHQSKGIGRALLEAVHAVAVQRCVLDVTVRAGAAGLRV